MSDEQRNDVQTQAAESAAPSQPAVPSSGKNPMPRKKKFLIACAAIVVVAVSVVTGMTVYAQQVAAEKERQAMMQAAVEIDTYYPGTIVQGVELGGMTKSEAKSALADAETAVRGEYDVTMKYGDKSWKVTTSDLIFSYDTDSVLEEAYAYARSGELEERYKLVTALLETPKEYAIQSSADTSPVSGLVEKVAQEVDLAPKDATIKSFNGSAFTFTDGQKGTAVDQQALTQQVNTILQEEKKGEVEVPVKELAFTLSAADLKKNIVKLGTYSTVSTNNANGNHNMALAMNAVNGAVLAPGGVFSYLGVVGSAGASSGYLEAGAIVNGKLVPSYGGGICQVSTTIYGAALRSNVQIVDRSNHSIRSSYVPIGQDAAVSYPSLDFKFKNATKYPMYIAAGMSGKTLTVTLYGWQSPDYDKIEITSQQVDTLPAISKPKYIVDRALASGTVRLDANARQGYKAVAQRVFYKNGAVTRTETLPSSYYPPAPAFYSIGPNTNVSTAASANLPSTGSDTQNGNNNENNTNNNGNSSNNNGNASKPSGGNNSGGNAPAVSSKPSAPVSSTPAPEKPVSSAPASPEPPASSVPAPEPPVSSAPAPSVPEVPAPAPPPASDPAPAVPDEIAPSNDTGIPG